MSGGIKVTMRFIRKISGVIAVLLIICIFGPVPVQAAAGLTPEGDVVIDNTYLQVIVKKDGKGFGIKTLEGHPLKATDNDKPLLYSGNDGFATSYTTVRIKHADGRVNDYIYGNSYGFMGMDGRFVEAPRAGSTDTSFFITSVWEVENVAIRQTIELSRNSANGEAGYTIIRYEYTNNSGKDLDIGVRILLDTQIADNDGGSFFLNSSSNYVSLETVFSGENVPDNYRIADAISMPSTLAYGSVSGTNIRKPDIVQVGHWFNLANTLWDFVPNTSINFASDYNPYKYADSAVGFVWNPVRTAAGASGRVETFYGIGAFTETDTQADDIIINVTQEKPLKVNADGTGYEDDGRVVLNVIIDNTSPNSVNLENVKITLKFQDKEYDEDGNIVKWPELYVESGKEEDEVISVGNIGRGMVSGTIPIVLKAKPQEKSIVRKVMLEVSYEGQPYPATASKFVTLPSIKNKMPSLSFVSVTPSKIYYEDPAVVTITGAKSEGSQ